MPRQDLTQARAAMVEDSGDVSSYTTLPPSGLLRRDSETSTTSSAFP